MVVIYFGVGIISLKFKMWWVIGYVLIVLSVFLVMVWFYNVIMKLNMVFVLSVKNVSLEKYILMFIILDFVFYVEFVLNMKKFIMNVIWY